MKSISTEWTKSGGRRQEGCRIKATKIKSPREKFNTEVYPRWLPKGSEKGGDREDSNKLKEGRGAGLREKERKGRGREEQSPSWNIELVTPQGG